MADYKENADVNSITLNKIQLVYNKKDFPTNSSDGKYHEICVRKFLCMGKKEPIVKIKTIPIIEDVKLEGDFGFVSLAQSPDYTPASADFILELFKDYILEN
jgi:hypothetical protein